ncbi:MAG: hypothetical protein EDM05_000320 (plasmid) [Leptolyngbya sp. IPPAS B-1204]
MHLIIRRAIRYQESWVAWCDEALAAIQASPGIDDDRTRLKAGVPERLSILALKITFTSG